ncbi:22475_t:CDS:2 [Rhizophagus irregularis]|nr:22475_t:CDS:2 [Rhizophagus irregularis]
MYFFCYTANPIIILPAVETARTNRTIAQLHMPLSSSKLNLIKSFVRKKFLDTSIFKSYKFDKEISNSIQGINNNNDNNVVHRKSIAFYAGAPLRTDDGNTICVIDREPRDSSSKKDRESLKEFAKVVMRELEL